MSVNCKSVLIVAVLIALTGVQCRRINSYGNLPLYAQNPNPSSEPAVEQQQPREWRFNNEKQGSSYYNYYSNNNNGDKESQSQSNAKEVVQSKPAKIWKRTDKIEHDSKEKLGSSHQHVPVLKQVITRVPFAREMIPLLIPIVSMPVILGGALLMTEITIKGTNAFVAPFRNKTFSEGINEFAKLSKKVMDDIENTLDVESGHKIENRVGQDESSEGYYNGHCVKRVTCEVVSRMKRFGPNKFQDVLKFVSIVSINDNDMATNEIRKRSGDASEHCERFACLPVDMSLRAFGLVDKFNRAVRKPEFARSLGRRLGIF